MENQRVVLRKFSLLGMMCVRCWDAFCHGCLAQELCRHCSSIHPSSVKITAESQGFICIVKCICRCIKKGCTVQNKNKADSCPRSSSIRFQMPMLNSSFQNFECQAGFPHALNAAVCWGLSSCSQLQPFLLLLLWAGLGGSCTVSCERNK